MSSVDSAVVTDLGAEARRIAVVLPSVQPLAGVERVMLSLIAEFAARGYAVDLVLAHETGCDPALLPPSVRVHAFGAPRLRSFFLPFTRYLRAEKPDALLVSLWPLTCICCVAHRLARSHARVVVCDHNTLTLQYRHRGWPMRLAMAASLPTTYPLADARVGVSSGVARDVARLARLPFEAMRVIHNPMPLPVREDKDYALVEAAWKGWQGRRILNVGSLKPQKNHALLIRAFQQVRRSTEARLMILGGAGGGERGAILTLIAAEGLQDDVIIVDHVDDPGPFYERADVFAFSSDYEGFANVVIEALAFGCPVVSTDCPSGPAEILENGKWGRLTPVGDANALAEAIVATLSSPPDRDGLKRRAADFAPPHVADHYLDLLLPGHADRPAIRSRESESAAAAQSLGAGK